MDAPATASTWSRLIGAARRALGLVEAPESYTAGPDYTPAVAQGQSYEAEQALSALAAFAWVRACVDAIATDLSGLPLVVSRGRGASAVRVDDHPVLDRLAQPTTWQTGEEWRRQLVVYLLLTGNAYALRLAGDASLPLLHPERVVVRPGPFGGPEGYTYGLGQDITYAPASVLHWRLASWQSDPEALLGTGLIQALHHDLSADLAASKLAAKQATQGRPPAVISPADGGEISDPETRAAIARSYAALVAKGDAAMVLSGAVKLDFPTYTPRDMEFQAQRQLTRETILAAFGVPPTRVGLPTANYATAQQQDRTYWTGLQGLARLLDGQLSRLVGRGERVMHDFSGVEALQEGRTERLNRVLTWTMLGATEADAAAYEGFHDAPVQAREPAPAPADAPPADTTQQQGLDGLFVVRDLDEEPMGELPAPPDLTTEEGRTRRWTEWLERAWKPSEARLHRATRAALRAQAARIAGRLDDAQGRGLLDMPPRWQPLVTRDLVGDLLAALMPSSEDAALRDALREALRAVLSAGYRETSSALGGSLRWEPTRRDSVTEAQLAELVSRVNATTREAIRRIITEGMEQGATVAEMQQRIQRAAALCVALALLVARSDSTRGVEAGSSIAYQEAQAAGVRVRVQWLSARDGAVRDSHRELDGQTVAVGETFTVHGQRARYPGDFADPGMSINCRCTTIPVVEDAA